MASEALSFECSYCDYRSPDLRVTAVSMDVVGRAAYNAATWLYQDHGALAPDDWDGGHDTAYVIEDCTSGAFEASVIDEVNAHITGDMLTVIEPGKKLYRARTAEDGFTFRRDSRDDPAKHLGPAPAGKASSGRLNPEGVGLFYGATTREVAVKETALHSLYDEPAPEERPGRLSIVAPDVPRTVSDSDVVEPARVGPSR